MSEFRYGEQTTEAADGVYVLEDVEPVAPPEVSFDGEDYEPAPPDEVEPDVFLEGEPASQEPTEGGEPPFIPPEGPPPPTGGSDETGGDDDESGPPSPEELLMAARAAAIAEADPRARLALSDGLISGGDVMMVEHALAALDAMPGSATEGSAEEIIDKIGGAHATISALAEQQRFSDADRVVAMVDTLDPRAGLGARAHLLRNGYAGVDGAYLQLDQFEFGDMIAEARLTGQLPQHLTNYLDALAAYGVDLLDRDTDAGRLFIDSAEAASPMERAFASSTITASYADAGHITEALGVLELITEPYARGMASVHIANAALDQRNEAGERNEALAERMLDEAKASTESIDNVDLVQGIWLPATRRPADIHDIQVAMAYTYAKRGDPERNDLEMAREIVNQSGWEHASGRAAVYAELYKQTGALPDRTNALRSLMDVGTAGVPANVETFIRGIAATDQQFGRMMPSVEAGEEGMPLICWEVFNIFRGGGAIEELAQSRDTLIISFSMDPEASRQDLLNTLARQRRLLLDRALAGLAAHTASTGNPRTAQSLLDLIDSPVQRVRAMAMVARIRSGPESG